MHIFTGFYEISMSIIADLKWLKKDKSVMEEYSAQIKQILKLDVYLKYQIKIISSQIAKRIKVRGTNDKLIIKLFDKTHEHITQTRVYLQTISMYSYGVVPYQFFPSPSNKKTLVYAIDRFDIAERKVQAARGEFILGRSGGNFDKVKENLAYALKMLS